MNISGLTEEFSFEQSRDISDYKSILEGLVEDFGYAYYPAILKWCKIIDDPEKTQYWEIYLIKCNKEVIGICGLYSLYDDFIDELWLGWFGVLPEHRNKKIGEKTLNFLKENAKSIGCKKIMSYVDAHGKPLPFYYRNGFKRVSSVKEYLEQHPQLSIKAFGNENDHVIECNI